MRLKLIYIYLLLYNYIFPHSQTIKLGHSRCCCFGWRRATNSLFCLSISLARSLSNSLARSWRAWPRFARHASRTARASRLVAEPRPCAHKRLELPHPRQLQHRHTLFFTHTQLTKATHELKGDTCAMFVSEFISCFGVLSIILTDSAATFLSIIFKETLNVYNIEHRLATPEHSQSNREPHDLYAKLIKQHLKDVSPLA